MGVTIEGLDTAAVTLSPGQGRAESSLKRLRVPGPYILFVLIGIGAVIAFLISTPWMTLGTAGLIYLGSIPLAWQSYRRLQKNPPPAPRPDEDEEEG